MKHSVLFQLRAVVTGLILLTAIAGPSRADGPCEPLGWRPVGGDVNGTIHAMVEFDDGSGPAIFVAGEFTEVGGTLAANRIAKWDGRNWATLGTGANDTIHALAVHDDGSGPALYAGGQFTSIGGVAASRIARWDGNSWLPLGSGVNSTVLAIIGHSNESGSLLYIGGSFTIAGGNATNYVAKWDGQLWSSMGSGTNNTVRALALFDDGSGAALFVAGQFTTAGGLAIPRIAKWNGATWAGVGNESVIGAQKLTVFDDGSGPALFSAGSFRLEDGSTVQVARWNGIVWSAVGFSVQGQVQAFGAKQREPGGRLHITMLGGPTLWYGGVMQWDGETWSTVGNAAFAGIQPNALLVSDMTGSPMLYAGGVPSGNGPPITFAVWPSAGFINHNANLFDDSCELASGMVQDCNLNGIPDETEATAAYVVEDAVYMQCWGVGIQSDFLWLNEFTVETGRELITHISVASPFGAPDGWPYQVHLFSDPNQDGNPIDAQLLASGSSAFLFTGRWDDPRFSPVAIPPTWVGPPGAKFFVGVLTAGQPGTWVAASDPNSVQAQRSWAKLDEPGSMNVANLGEGHPPQLLTSAAWMLRALSMDCNSNDVWDECDIEDGVSLDLNKNGLPDECEPEPLPCALADLAPPGGDGSVGVPDLLFIINAWGPCPKSDVCVGDIAPPGGDGWVGTPDLLAVIIAWGPCP